MIPEECRKDPGGCIESLEADGVVMVAGHVVYHTPHSSDRRFSTLPCPAPLRRATDRGQPPGAETPTGTEGVLPLAAMPPAAAIELRPVEGAFALKDRIHRELRAAILEVDVYASRSEHRLDERQLADQLGVSRTPVREALQRLEHEGLVVSLPRRGTFVARKTRQEIIETITAWAALESMAARLATLHGSDAEIRRLREMFAEFAEGQVQARIDEYSETNLLFHQAILRMGKSRVLDRLAENLLLHMRSIRKHTIGERDRAERSIIDHMHIIEALETRDTERAERLVRQHSLDLASHVEAHVDWLD